MQSLKRIGPESHALALRRGSDGAELVKKDLAAAAMAPGREEIEFLISRDSRQSSPIENEQAQGRA